MDAAAIHVFEAAPRPFRKDNAAGKKETVWIQGEDEPVVLTPGSIIKNTAPYIADCFL